MKIGVLTSSRADFGIYFPLLDKLRDDPFFDLEIIAFGTHLKKEFGHTIDEIKQQGFYLKHTVDTLIQNDSPQDISYSIGQAVVSFSSFWAKNKFDLVLAFGDRYEMFAAVVAASPFDINIAHIHAGETTLGAIDNAYRHSISLMSKVLFVTTEKYKLRAKEIVEDSAKIFNVGALSIDNLKNQELFSKEEFEDRFAISLEKPSILSTFHPETVNYQKNVSYIEELISAFEELRRDYQIIVTMPNSDTMGNMIRTKLIDFAKGKQEVKLIESFGMKGYLTCMKYCNFMLGNTSSGFVEASFFPKWVINLGNRQEGRINTSNIMSIPVNKDRILKAVKIIENQSFLPKDCNIYGNGNTANEILKIIKQ